MTTFALDSNIIFWSGGVVEKHYSISWIFFLHKLCFFAYKLIIQDCCNLKIQWSIFSKLTLCILNKVVFIFVWLKLKISSMCARKYQNGMIH